MLRFTFLFCTLILSIISAQNFQDSSFQTYFEKSSFLETPGYDESIAFFSKIEKNSPYVKMFTFGTSPQDRELKYLVVSKEKGFTFEKAKKSNKAIVMIQNEIEGKDACMLLLREILITKEKENVLDNVILVIIPVLNVDGHERISAYNRINQNGPKEMGWRTSAQNLNLNRDYMKADSPEIQAFLKLFSNWLPDFFIDTHTTDGADYQYSITYGVETHQNIYSETREWLKKNFNPFLKNYVEKDGFLISPYVGFKDGKVESGLTNWAALPRLSTGYLAVQNRPSLLIETHMLKPYKERVYSTKSAIYAVLEFVNKYLSELKKINDEADKSSITDFLNGKIYLPVSYKRTDESGVFNYKGIKSVEDSSWVTGTSITRFTGEKYEMEIPYFNKIIANDSVTIPSAYLIPSEWGNVIERIKLHGIQTERISSNQKFVVEKYKFKNVKFAAGPYEGRHQPSFEYDVYTDTIEAVKGDHIINTNQRTIRVIANLLEPKSPDSFVKWGLFNAIFEQKEYFEDYSMEIIAREMAEKNPELKKEFLKRVNSDEKFRNDPHERLNFFYERSPYFDEKMNEYPVMRIKDFK